MTVGVWIYDKIPGTHPKWTVAMYAINQADADYAIKTHWGGGHRIGYHAPGKIKSDCGDVSDEAAKVFANTERNAQ